MPFGSSSRPRAKKSPVRRDLVERGGTNAGREAAGFVERRDHRSSISHATAARPHPAAVARYGDTRTCRACMTSAAKPQKAPLR